MATSSAFCDYYFSQGYFELVVPEDMESITTIISSPPRRDAKITDNLSRVTREHLTGMRVIRAYSPQKFHQHRFETVHTELCNTSLFINTGMEFILPILSTIMTGLSLAIYILGAVLINGTAAVSIRGDGFEKSCNWCPQFTTAKFRTAIYETP
ncbi:MAG: hypothetical protein Q3974_08310 [Rothia sp. (in: high G+C Gram-positive bacteria)]|nr:hypothetical protein [Rothia sp. (in: high G+C Gram-positive bacteria)]